MVETTLDKLKLKLRHSKLNDLVSLGILPRPNFTPLSLSQKLQASSSSSSSSSALGTPSSDPATSGGGAGRAGGSGKAALSELEEGRAVQRHLIVAIEICQRSSGERVESQPEVNI